jgi:hypothetical protein
LHCEKLTIWESPQRGIHDSFLGCQDLILHNTNATKKPSPHLRLCELIG